MANPRNRDFFHGLVQREPLALQIPQEAIVHGGPDSGVALTPVNGTQRTNIPGVDTRNRFQDEQDEQRRTLHAYMAETPEQRVQRHRDEAARIQDDIASRRAAGRPQVRYGFTF